MKVIWGIVVVALSLLAWAGQMLAWFAPSTAVRCRHRPGERTTARPAGRDTGQNRLIQGAISLMTAETSTPPTPRCPLLDSRPAGRKGWNAWRAVVGVAYLAAAGFNAVYTLPRTEQLDGYADGAWFGFLGDFMRDVFIPNGTLFMSAVIIFEICVAALVLHRDRYVDTGVAASVLWVLIVLPFLAWPYLITNLVLAPAQGILLFRCYETPLWRR